MEQASSSTSSVSPAPMARSTRRRRSALPWPHGRCPPPCAWPICCRGSSCGEKMQPQKRTNEHGFEETKRRMNRKRQETSMENCNYCLRRALSHFESQAFDLESPILSFRLSINLV